MVKLFLFQWMVHFLKNDEDNSLRNLMFIPYDWRVFQTIETIHGGTYE